MNTLERLKLANELKKAIDNRNGAKSPIAKLKLAKQVQDLRRKLGLTTLSDDDVERLSQIEIDVAEKSTKGERKRTAKDWIKENLLGKSVKTIDGKTVHFNSEDTVGHISYNAMSSRNNLVTLTIPFIPQIFAKGEFVGRELPNHNRADESIIAFHLYRKWVQVKSGKDTFNVYAEVQACERENSKDLYYSAYNLKALDKNKAIFDGLPYLGLHQADNHVKRHPALHNANKPTQIAYNHSTPLFDEMQAVQLDEVIPLRILQVLDENGNDITEQVLDDDKGQAQNTIANRPALPVAKTTRQKANNIAIDLVKRINDENLSRDDLTTNVNNRPTPQNKTALTSDLELLVIEDDSKVKKSVLKYLSQLSNKYITTVDGKHVIFNSNGRNHLANDVVFGDGLVAKAVEKIVEVLTQGQFIHVENLKKNRNDNFIAFHVYRKWVTIDHNGVDKDLHLQIKVAELADGTFEVGNGLIAYSAKDAENKKVATPPTTLNSVSINSEDDHLLDDINTHLNLSQDDYVFLEILEVRQARPTLPVAKSARQKANNIAIDLVKRINDENLSRDDLTTDELTALAKFTGGGGGLINADGTKGSDYEYYTPKELASGVWDIAKALGFNGGKVLDPSAGTGVFTATSPQNALMDSVELDNTSGTIAKILNDGERSKTTISPFEAVAKDLVDGSDSNGYDLVITNVPFGDNKARGANKMLDKAYQKESLDYYFIVRSLEKLKSNGLAVFITTPSTIHGKRKQQIELRQRTSRIAHFLGAYRLPNRMFADTGADVSVDVIAFKKYDDKTRSTIANYYEHGDIATLENSGIYWADYISGNYFNTRKNQILGDEVEEPDWRDKSKTVTKVVTHQSMAEVIAQLRQFSRATNTIDWESLALNEPTAIDYQAGDIIQKDGNSYQYDGAIWQQIDVQKSDDILAKEAEYNELIRLLDSPYDVVMNHIHVVKMAELMEWVNKTAQQGVLTERLTDIFKQSQGQNGAWLAMCASHAINKLIEAHGAGFNYLAEYQAFSEKFKDVIVLAKSVKLKGTFNTAYKNVLMHYNKGEYSSLWRGTLDTQVVELDENFTPQSILAKFQYENKSPYITLEQLKAVGADKDSEDWFIVGEKAIHKNDFLVGNLADRLADIDQWLADDTLDTNTRNKLLRQREMAIREAGTIDVRAMRYDLQSPLISAEFKVAFLKTLTPYAEIVDNKPFIKLPKTESDIDKLMNRIGIWLKNGGLSLGGISLSEMTEKEAIAWLNKTANSYNEQFNNWVKVNDRLLNALDARLNDPNNRYFSQNDDEAPIAIAGLSNKLKLHPHQNAFVRNQGRSFGGINGFGVGLGKTFTALASIQHAHNIGAKQRTLIVVPKSVLSNWRKEAMFAYQSMSDCIFIGLREQGDKFTVKSTLFDTDLTESLDGKYRKIFMTFEAFRRIRLMDNTFDEYHDHLQATDENYALGERKKDNERALGRGAELKQILIQSSANNAPYLEHMNIDSIVIDEAHAFKNSISATDVGRIKYLSNPTVSTRGLDAQIKTWYIRGLTAMGDGVQLLTATPITNSPVEIYSMLALAVGRERANAMSGGIKGVDDFIKLVCDTEHQDVIGVDNALINIECFTGLRNIHLLRSAIHHTASIKTADDVKGLSVVIPERHEIASSVQLPNELFDDVKQLQQAYGVAKGLLNNKSLKDFPPELRNAYSDVKQRFGESDELIAHPFNLIRKMEVMIADSEFVDGGSFYDFDTAQMKLVEKAIAEFNKKKYKDETARLSMYTDSDNAQTIMAKNGDERYVKGFKYAVQAQVIHHNERERIVLDTLNSATQARFEEICDKLGVKLNITIPAKLSALLENFKAEMAHKRGVNSDGTNSKIVKQIIFCDHLFLHNKIVRLLSTMGGVAKDKIAIITGQINSEADEIIDIQNGFNDMGDDNRYQVIIANKKAEVGINLQKGTQAIHHLTTGWTPDSIEQRNGRGARQGNHTETVHIYYYDADGTFDSLKRSMVNKKDEWISDLLQGDSLSVAVASDLSNDDKDALINAVGDENAIQNYLKQKQLNDEIARQNTATARQMINVETIYQNKAILARSYYDDLVDKVEEFIKTAVEFNKAKGIVKGDNSYSWQNNYRVVDVKSKTQAKIYERLEQQFNAILAMISTTNYVSNYSRVDNKLDYILETMAFNGLGTTRSYGFGSKADDRANNLFGYIFENKPKARHDYGIDESWINKEHENYQIYLEQQQMAQKLIDQAIVGIDDIANTVGGQLPVGAGQLIKDNKAVILNDTLYQVGDVFSVDLGIQFDNRGEKIPHVAVIRYIETFRDIRIAHLIAVNDSDRSYYRHSVQNLTIGTNSEKALELLNAVKPIAKDSSDYIDALKEMARLEMVLSDISDSNDSTPYSRILPEVNEYKIAESFDSVMWDSVDRDNLPPNLPSSENIDKFWQARNYWQAHFKDKTYNFKVYRKKKEPTEIMVHFGDTNHAYTDDVDKTGDNRQRVFDEKRAKVMDKIFKVIQSPSSVLISQGNELLIDYLMNGEHYVVVLKYNQNANIYEFLSAHFKKERQIQGLKNNQANERKRYDKKTPLVK